MDILLPLDQQVERVQDRQAGFNQGKKLLVENDKLALADLASPGKWRLAGSKQAAWLHPVNQVTLLHETVAHLGLGEPALDLLQQVPALVGCLNEKFCHLLTSVPLEIP